MLEWESPLGETLGSGRGGRGRGGTGRAFGFSTPRRVGAPERMGMRRRRGGWRRRIVRWRRRGSGGDKGSGGGRRGGRAEDGLRAVPEHSAGEEASWRSLQLRLVATPTHYVGRRRRNEI